MRTTVPCLFALAVLALSAMSQGDSETKPITRLVAQLRTAKDSETRRKAAEALGEIGDATETIVAALGQALHDSDLVVRGASARALAKLGKNALPTLVDSLGSGDRYTRSHVLQALHDLGKDAAPAVPAVVALLKDPHADAAVRGVTPWTLAAIGGASLPLVQATLRDPDPVARLLAADAIGRIGQRNDGVIKTLERMLKLDEPEVRVAAGLALRRLDEPVARVLPHLIEVLQRGPRAAQTNTLRVLAVFGKDAQSAAKPVVDVLRRDRKYRLSAERNAREKSLEAAFYELAGMEDPGLDLVGVHALGELRSPKAVPFLIETIQYTDQTIRKARAEGSLHRYNPKASMHFSLRSQTVEALGKIGSGAVGAVSTLLDVFGREPDNTVIIRTLGLIGAPAAVALPVLEKALRSPVSDTRAAAKQAIRRIRGE